MVITGLNKGKKGMVDLCIDGEHFANVEKNALDGLYIGMEVTAEQLEKTVNKSETILAKKKALALITIRDYTRAELIGKLSVNVSETAAQNAADYLESLGYLNDRRYAENYAYELLVSKKVSRFCALYKMTQRGLERGLCEEALDKVEIDPEEQIHSLISKKYREQIADEKGRRRTFAALRRMGYSCSEISAAIRSFTEDWNESDEL